MLTGIKDITEKQISLRTARAVGIVYCSESSVDAVRNGTVPKGSVLDICRAAGLIGAKSTPSLIPHCHPVTIDGLSVEFQLCSPGDEFFKSGLKAKKAGIAIEVLAKSINKTGIEMEALTSVSITALTLYDLLKYMSDPELEISEIKLMKKTGGKSDKKRFSARTQQAALLVCSQEILNGNKEDKASPIAKELLEKHNCEIVDHEVLESKKEVIQNKIKDLTAEGVPFIFTIGGTALGKNDQTIEAVEELLDKEIPGISEAMRVHGGMRTPLAMLSRSVAGVIDHSIVITLPGSSNGTRESLEAILPGVFHGHWMIKGL